MRDRERQRRNRRLKHMYQKLEKKIEKERTLLLDLSWRGAVKSTHPREKTTMQSIPTAA